MTNHTLAAAAERRTLRIATRESPLALWQAEHVAVRLRTLHPRLEVALLGMTTQGDQLLDSPLARIGGKGLFVKELEQALLEGRADLAVHSLKDVPMQLPEGLVLAGLMERENPTDAWVSPEFAGPEALPQGAVVGTSSLRRQAQLLARRPDLRIEPLRGNVNTRLRKLDDGQYQGIVLASAGLTRLGFGERIRATLPWELMLPAVGQGVLGLELRADDAVTQALIAPLHHPASALAAWAERACNARLNGGCQAPIAAHARWLDAGLQLSGMVASVDGQRLLRIDLPPLAGGPDALSRHDVEAQGIELAEALLAAGAAALLAEAGIEAGERGTGADEVAPSSPADQS